MGSCMTILAIAYMDHLNIPTDRGTHQINYNLPRICNVSNQDFEFVMKVDRNRMALDNAYGKLPFRDFCHTPYADAPVIQEPIAHDEVPVVSSASLDDWLHQPESSMQCLQQLPPEYQKVAVQFSNLMEQDVDELAEVVAANMKDKIKALWRKRNAQMMVEMGALNKQNKVSSGISLHPPKSTTNGDGAPKASTSDHETSQPPDDKVIELCPEAKDALPSVLCNTDATNENASLSAAGPSPIPDIELSPHPSPAHLKINKNETIEINSGTRTHEKRNRKKRAAIDLNLGKKRKKIKLDEETKVAYTNYVSKRLRQKEARDPEDKKERPPFIQIAGFHVTYDEFYESLKQRGKVDNNVMSLWTYQFNLDEAEARVEDSTIVKKYAFSSVIVGQLTVDLVTFKSQTCNKELARLNNTWKLSKLDLLFFPIVRREHWVLACINMFLKQINFFNSINASTDTPCFESFNNLISNFSKAAMESGVITEDVSQFMHIYPTEYPQQNTLNDCGLYTMLYIQSWDGKKMNVTFDSGMIADYRKFVAGSLLLSPINEIDTSEFVKKHCIHD